MSMSDVRPFFEARAKALQYGIHKEAFSSEDLAKNSGKKCFIKLGSPQARMAQQSVDFMVPVTVDLYFGQARSTTDLEDRALDAAEAFVSNVGSNRFGVSGVNGVFMRSLELVQLDDSNDNALIARLGFEALVVVAY